MCTQERGAEDDADLFLHEFHEALAIGAQLIGVLGRFRRLDTRHLEQRQLRVALADGRLQSLLPAFFRIDGSIHSFPKFSLANTRFPRTGLKIDPN